MDELFSPDEHDIRRRADVLPCGCPREANPEDECNGWHWPRQEWDATDVLRYTGQHSTADLLEQADRTRRAAEEAPRG